MKNWELVIVTKLSAQRRDYLYLGNDFYLIDIINYISLIKVVIAASWQF